MENNTNNNNSRFLVLKIIGCVGIAIAVTGIIIYICNLAGEFSTGLFITGLLMMILGILSGVPCLFFGFLPRLLAARISAMQQLQQQNISVYKELYAAAAQATANAQATAQASDAPAKEECQENVAVGSQDASNEEAKDNSKMYCKHCGAQIDSDSKFCKVCGKEQ